MRGVAVAHGGGHDPSMIKARGVCSVVLVCIAAGGAGCSGDVQPSKPSKPTTVLLVTIDTWRSDTNGFLGGQLPSPTPYLDQLAKRGLVADNAVAPVPLTGPSHWSMLTGRWPWMDGVRVNGDPPAPTGDHLVERLQSAGWRTGGFVSAGVLDDRFGFGRGFDHFDDKVATVGVQDIDMQRRSGDATVNAALQWLTDQPTNAPVFAWVHLFDPHFPYARHPGLEGFDPYDAEVAFADAQVRRLGEGITKAGRDPGGTLWFVLADHGEGQGEHGARSHGLLLHRAAMDIPLLIAGPGIAPSRVKEPVTTVDIAPTMLSALGIPRIDADGLDLGGPIPADRTIPMESLFGLRVFGLSPAWGLRTAEWLWESSPEDHLWDLNTDPAEEHDVVSQQQEVVAALVSARRKFAQPAVEVADPQDAETRAMLQALGYVGGGQVAGEGDLRQFALTGEPLHIQIKTAQAAGDLKLAESLLVRFLEQYPNAATVWIDAGFSALSLNDMTLAEQRFANAARLDPNSAAAHLNHANVLYVTGRYPQAAKEYERTLELDPDDPFALYNLGQLRANEGRLVDAARVWRHFVESHPDHQQAPAVRTELAAWERAGVAP